MCGVVVTALGSWYRGPWFESHLGWFKNFFELNTITIKYFKDPNAAKIQVQRPTLVTQEGSVATLKVYVSGYPQPDVYWKKGQRDIDVRRGKYKIIDGGSLQVNIIFIFGENIVFL